MRPFGLVLLAAACGSPAVTPIAPTQAPPDLANVCKLVQGDVTEWRGLPELPIAKAPRCLGTRTETVESDPGAGFLERATFRSDASRVDLTGSGRAELVDVIPDVPPSAATMLEKLGAPDARGPYDAELRRRKPIGSPGESIDEVVYARRGLTLLVDEHGRLLRLRGFTPMSVERYEAMYGRYHPVKFEP